MDKHKWVWFKIYDIDKAKNFLYAKYLRKHCPKCPQCKGDGHYEATLKNHGANSTDIQIVPCDYPTCNRGYIDPRLAEEQRQYERDCGIWNNKNVRNKIRAACEKLRQTFRGKSCRGNWGSSWECFVPFETNGDIYIGVRVRVSLNKTKRSSFFSIDIDHSQTDKNPFRGL